MWVRSSSACYRTFNLAKDRSLGFGSTARDYAPYSDSVSLRLPYTVKLATDSKSLTHYTKGTQSGFRPPTVCRHPVSGTVSLPSSGCFSPFPHGTCSLSVAQEYLGLESGLPMFRQDCTCPALLVSLNLRNPYGAITHYGPTFQSVRVERSEALAWSAFARHY